ncbi:fructosamine kinase family protein [Nocardia sp. NBC_00565]|uniref:fructosamine kinase family protein n=1 Tax=Nocardia sp. NBC_00565 TaxID=2975993 RepID=UPI002E80987E|nr:fructosamine kinase family protein [Nocardia sp. NBC_00565]WUC06222.1 fructosamine kinase family protein [Nocardia sp. NBC_00565]
MSVNEAAHIAGMLGVSVREVNNVGSSHSWTLHRAVLADGREVFVKASLDQAAVFEAEAAGLRWLANGAPELVPEVLAVDERMLVLPWLPQVAPTAAAAERFGRDLAALHVDSPGSFGAPWPGWIADLPLDNTPADGPWSRWYAERRLAPYLPRAAADLGRDGIRLLERVIENIETLAGPPEPPSRIHGDLWSGNVLWTADRAVLIDPAAHGGHRETDLAMLALFGTPHLDRIRAAYTETHPLADGWRTRIPLHQLHPLLVHIVLFGGGYRTQTLAAAAAALGT